ncbi:NAD(P)/FAD-dependent oxidoreductase [Corynebacterium breve]|uniref:NAD(P)/FAD-dependent oxidoreductase n=1 Tax=Corynebacterium breve TaxID=3049799 RepID=A0ABY8VKG3_9CORY|nr:NAD(P)/FAD-dependent oxidoreductase [Corynebacterium breve]WIM68060.1 NAD(P)/FAD-dependent oxidoreductase [Corynebacterium breve]
MSDQLRAVIVGSGPNGLTAAARLATAGWEVDVYERADSIGGAAASTSTTFSNDAIVDLGAAGHPFGVASPAFRSLDLEQHGLEWVTAPYEMAHPLVDDDTAFLSNSLEETAASLGEDAQAWKRLHGPTVSHIDQHLENFLGPILRWPNHPLRMVQFGPPALLPASVLGKALFTTERARALLAGSAVHAIASPAKPCTGAFGMLFGGLGMTRGWPVARGGTQAIVDALSSVITLNGGKLHTGREVTDLRELPPADATVLNLTPRQILRLRGTDLPDAKKRQLGRWKYGTATYKVDFLLSEPVPWTDPRVGQAGTVHLGGKIEEIAFAEDEAAAGRMPERPFVMACQQFAADPSRGLTLWTYAHVPHGYVEKHPNEVRDAIINQIERFAPGFRDTIVAAEDTSPAALEDWNPNLVGGDIAGGSMSGAQVLLRPGLALRPHRLRRGLYLASASTPPGAGVHGMPGWWAAHEAMVDHKRTL